MSNTGWYERFAGIYDIGTLGDWFYRGARRDLVERLGIASGDTVFDVFCGTGVNLPLLASRVAPGGRIVAVDGSPAMLRRAERRAGSLAATAATAFITADLASDAGVERLCRAIATERPARLLFTLGLTCLPGWRAFLERVIEAAPSGARVGILDVYSDRLTAGARLINRIGAADCTRPVWRVLEERGERFDRVTYRPFKVLDVSVFVAVASVP